MGIARVPSVDHQLAQPLYLPRRVVSFEPQPPIKRSGDIDHLVSAAGALLINTQIE